jgi:hypothetical protein
VPPFTGTPKFSQTIPNFKSFYDEKYWLFIDDEGGLHTLDMTLNEKKTSYFNIKKMSII